ncbi:hypothetical protein [Bacillus sp. REN3]|uniref:hypothetical protein n=1 Tax=Bacillus sp. REN3 TaxID=2802440 RepID=UPI001AEEF5AE|nr:hypothetical protein [Bacillus sp. REN3]
MEHRDGSPASLAFTFKDCGRGKSFLYHPIGWTGIVLSSCKTRSCTSLSSLAWRDIPENPKPDQYRKYYGGACRGRWQLVADRKEGFDSERDVHRIPEIHHGLILKIGLM